MELGMRKWYVPLLILLATCFAPWLKEQKRVGALEDAYVLQTAPKYSEAQAYAEFVWVKERIEEWGKSERAERNIPNDPKAYWEFLDRERHLREALGRLMRESDPRLAMVAEKWHSSISLRMPIGIIQYRFKQKFGDQIMLEARPRDWNKPKVFETPNSRLEKFGLGYLWSIPVMMLVFALRLRIKGLMIYPEIPKIVLAAIFWPAGLMVFPGDIRREEQMKKGLFILAQLSSLSLVFMGFGPVALVVKAQPKTREGTEKSERKRTSKFSFGTELYPVTSGVD